MLFTNPTPQCYPNFDQSGSYSSVYFFPFLFFLLSFSFLRLPPLHEKCVCVCVYCAFLCRKLGRKKWIACEASLVQNALMTFADVSERHLFFFSSSL